MGTGRGGGEGRGVRKVRWGQVVAVGRAGVFVKLDEASRGCGEGRGVRKLRRGQVGATGMAGGCS